MIEAIFSGLEGSYATGEFDEETSFYFSIDDTNKTIRKL
jgi:hypothetical protein